MMSDWILSAVEKVKLSGGATSRVETGGLVLDREVFDLFRSAPFDICPDFEGPPSSHLARGRGKDHPRYGRFIYALARHLRPEMVVEVGTYAGGTSVGWAKALAENGGGRLVCLDNDTYSNGTYPAVTRRNLAKTGLPESRLELLSGDSKTLLPDLARRLPAAVDIYLVDGDHTYEGALHDIENGLPLMKSGGIVLVHDVDPARRMDEQTPEHPHPVLEAFRRVVDGRRDPWCILRFIRKHLGIFQIR